MFILGDPRYGLVLPLEGLPGYLVFRLEGLLCCLEPPPEGLLRYLVQLLGWRQPILTRTS